MPSAPGSHQALPRISHAQTGQDILAAYFFQRYKLLPPDVPGFYVDVGCAWPVRHSNTYYFYERGWRGVCIDANPNLQAEFEAKRPGDIFVHAGIGETPSIQTLYMFKDPKHNTMSPKRRDRWAQNPDRAHLFRGEVKVPIRRMSEVLDAVAPGRERIDLLSVDVESMELEVLRSLDFTRHRPSMVVIEMLVPMDRVTADPVTRHCLDLGYELSHSSHDAIFIRR